MLVANRLRVPHLTIRRLRPVRPEVENDPICLSRNRCDFLRLRLGHVENLNPPRRDLYLMIMVILIPCLQRDMSSGNRLSDEIFDVRQQCVRIG